MREAPPPSDSVYAQPTDPAAAAQPQEPKCHCYPGFTGQGCESYEPGNGLCVNDCTSSAHGFCVRGVCSCKAGWFGLDCSVNLTVSAALPGPGGPVVVTDPPVGRHWKAAPAAHRCGFRVLPSFFYIFAVLLSPPLFPSCFTDSGGGSGADAKPHRHRAHSHRRAARRARRRRCSRPVRRGRTTRGYTSWSCPPGWRATCGRICIAPLWLLRLPEDAPSLASFAAAQSAALGCEAPASLRAGSPPRRSVIATKQHKHRASPFFALRPLSLLRRPWPTGATAARATATATPSTGGRNYSCPGCCGTRPSGRTTRAHTHTHPPDSPTAHPPCKHLSRHGAIPLRTQPTRD